MMCFINEECQPGGLGWGWGHPPDTPHSAGCLACPVRNPCPLGTAMFSSCCSPLPLAPARHPRTPSSRSIE